MTDKIALISGVTGQDGAYLAELLLAKGYIVHGVKRRSSSLNTERVDHLYTDPHVETRSFFLHYGDMTDATNLIRLIQETQPTEIYNLAAQSHVQVSFETPEYTANSDALGTLRLLEAIRILGWSSACASIRPPPRSFTATCRRRRSARRPRFSRAVPYAAAKLYAYWITVNYREAYGIHASNGILFNHESPMRGETFVTRKVTRAVAAIQAGQQDKLFIRQSRCQTRLGSCEDYVRGHVDDPAASDIQTTMCWRPARRIPCANSSSARLQWSVAKSNGEDSGGTKLGFDAKTGQVLVAVDPRYFRPTEVDLLHGDASKAKRVLGWSHRVSFVDLVTDMVNNDLKILKKAMATK